MYISNNASPSPSACVVPIRDGADGLEILLLRRNPKSSAFAGAWAFPGGHIEAADRGEDEETAARAAAVREAWEETGLDPKNR